MVALLAVYFIWGSTYLAIRVVVTNGLPPLLSMGVRFVAAGLLLAVGVRLAAGKGALTATRRQLATTAVVGILLLCGGNGLVALAERSVPSGLTALLVSTTPLWIVVLGLAVGERARPLSLVGTLVGFAGTAVLARPGASGSVAWQGVVLILVATASLGHRLALLAPARLARQLLRRGGLPDAASGARPSWSAGWRSARRARSTSGPCRRRGGGRWRTSSSWGAWSRTRPISGCSRTRRCSS